MSLLDTKIFFNGHSDAERDVGGAGSGHVDYDPVVVC